MLCRYMEMDAALYEKCVHDETERASKLAGERAEADKQWESIIKLAAAKGMKSPGPINLLQLSAANVPPPSIL